jgi:hypothetical protein
MKDLKFDQDIIENERKKSSFHDFIVEIASWYPLSLYKRELLSRYPNTERSPKIVSSQSFYENIDQNHIY